MNFFKQLKISKLNQMVAFTVLGLCLVGCGPGKTTLSILAANQSAFQGSVSNNKVDILWVIDNSGSMLTKQQNLANSFDSFAQVFLDKGFDFHMAIITTDTRATPTGQAGEFQGATPVLTSTTANFSSTFKTNVVVGALGDAAAKSLDATELALGSTLLAGTNANFLRSDAHLAIIYLSDADDDDSMETKAGLLSFLDALKPDKFDVIARRYKKNYTISGVVVDTSNTANTACAAPFEDGLTFKSLVTSTNGSLASICEADFSSGLTTLSNKIAEAITEIPLSREPDSSTIAVTFNGTAVPNDATNGYTYDSSGIKIVFHGTSIPNDNTTISINFIPKDIIR